MSDLGNFKACPLFQTFACLTKPSEVSPVPTDQPIANVGVGLEERVREKTHLFFCSRAVQADSSRHACACFGELNELAVILSLRGRNGWSMDSISRGAQTQTSEVELRRNRPWA